MICAECGKTTHERWAQVVLPGIVYDLGSAVCLLRFKVRLLAIAGAMDATLEAMLKPLPVYEDVPVPDGDKLA